MYRLSLVLFRSLGQYFHDGIGKPMIGNGENVDIGVCPSIVIYSLAKDSILWLIVFPIEIT